VKSVLLNITEKMVLGTAQFGMDYGIANINGKPKKKEVFGILDLACEKGIRQFDTAPGYGSEALLGEFIMANNLQDEAIVLTKIPSLEGVSDYEKFIRTSLELSLKNLGCSIDVLFFHNPADSGLLLKYPQFFENLLRDYPVLTLGVSVYETKEVKVLSGCPFELAFQFPFNVLDRRFEHVNVPEGKRYARSVFLQGLLATPNGLRKGAPRELSDLQKKYYQIINAQGLDPIALAIYFVAKSEHTDYFLVGLDSEEQLQEIFNSSFDLNPLIKDFDLLLSTIHNKWLDPRTWN